MLSAGLRSPLKPHKGSGFRVQDLYIHIYICLHTACRLIPTSRLVSPTQSSNVGFYRASAALAAHQRIVCIGSISWKLVTLNFPPCQQIQVMEKSQAREATNPQRNGWRGNVGAHVIADVAQNPGSINSISWSGLFDRKVGKPWEGKPDVNIPATHGVELRLAGGQGFKRHFAFAKKLVLSRMSKEVVGEPEGSTLLDAINDGKVEFSGRMTFMRCVASRKRLVLVPPLGRRIASGRM